MAVRFKVLAHGRLWNGTLYQVPTGKAVVVNSIRAVRSVATTQLFDYYTIGVKHSGIPVTVFPQTGSTDGGVYTEVMMADDRELTLGEGDEIVATVQSVSASAIDYIICGVERDV